jgi:hypothetical protein
VWIFRKEKERNIILKYVRKCAGNSSFKNPSGNNTGEIYSRRRANGKEEKIRLLEEMPCSQSRAF